MWVTSGLFRVWFNFFVLSIRVLGHPWNNFSNQDLSRGNSNSIPRHYQCSICVVFCDFSSLFWALWKFSFCPIDLTTWRGVLLQLQLYFCIERFGGMNWRTVTEHTFIQWLINIVHIGRTMTCVLALANKVTHCQLSGSNSNIAF